MPKPNEKQIKKEIETLRDYCKRVRPNNFFGESNVDAICAQIDVLEKGMDEDDIWDTWDAEEDERIIANATDAYEWMIGGSKDKPSEGWKPLLQK